MMSDEASRPSSSKRKASHPSPYPQLGSPERSALEAQDPEEQQLQIGTGAVQKFLANRESRKA